MQPVDDPESISATVKLQGGGKCSFELKKSGAC